MMLGKFFANWALRSRAKMLMQELNWELEAADPVFRARVALLANMLRAEMIDPDPLMRSMVDDPFQHSVDDLAAFYNEIENVRNADKAKHRKLHQYKKSVGSPPELDYFDEEQTKASQRSLEVWMATSAIPIVKKNGIDYGAKIWDLISVSDDLISAALGKMRALEKCADEAGGGSMCLPTRKKAIELCQYRPSALQ